MTTTRVRGYDPFRDAALRVVRHDWLAKPRSPPLSTRLQVHGFRMDPVRIRAVSHSLQSRTAAHKGTTPMALDQYSLAALIEQQMDARGTAPDAVSLRPVGADYLWNALGEDLRRARILSRMIATLPTMNSAAAGDPVRRLEPA